MEKHSAVEVASIRVCAKHFKSGIDQLILVQVNICKKFLCHLALAFRLSTRILKKGL